MSKPLNSESFPAAFAAMDAAAKGFWAYPDARWQDDFLRAFARATLDGELLLAVDGGGAA